MIQRPRGRETQKGRQPETASQLRRSQNSRAPGAVRRRVVVQEARRRMVRGQPWPRAVEGNTLEEKPTRATAEVLQDLGGLRVRGTKP